VQQPGRRPTEWRTISEIQSEIGIHRPSSKIWGTSDSTSSKFWVPPGLDRQPELRSPDSSYPVQGAWYVVANSRV
jgi:hypothetical protein